MLLKDIVEKENKLKPFNDEKIVEILEKDEFLFREEPLQNIVKS